MDFNWTDEAIADMRQMHDAGYSMSEIAAGLGKGLTRNAVTGKLHRLGLARGKVAAKPGSVRARRKARRASGAPPKQRATRKGSLNEVAQLSRLTGESKPVELPPERIEDQDIPVGQRRTLMDLTNETCRWPIGTPGIDLFFCGAGGADCDAGKPYCRAHAAIAFNGKPQRGAPFIPRRAA